MADTDTKVGLLATQPLSAGCGPRQVQRLGAACDWITADPGTTLTVEGRAGPSHLPLRNATVVATQPSRLFVFDARGFASMLSQMPAVAERIREQAQFRQSPSALSN